MILGFCAPHRPSVDIALVGDIMLGRWVGREISQRGSDYAFSAVTHELKKSDLAIGNLECVLGKSPFTQHKRFLLRGDPKQAPSMRRAGFSALTLANNHSLDSGKSGLRETLTNLQQARIATLGIETNSTIFFRKGVRIAFLAYCDFPNDSGGPGIQYTNEFTLKSDIAKAKAKADVVAVFWHWGTELSQIVNQHQRHLAKLAAEDGADMVIGCHPHVIQPLQWLRVTNHRRCLVAYSLGNFIFDAPKGLQSQSEILHILVTKQGVKEVRITPYRIVHCRPIKR